MKKVLLLPVILLAFALPLLAQIPYPAQPQPTYYGQVKSICSANIPSKAELMALKPGGLPNGLLDSLLKYDWYEVSSYHYLSGEYASYYTAIEKTEASGMNVQLPFRRFQPNLIVYEMTLNHNPKDPAKVLTTTFDESTAQKLVEVRRTQAGASFLVTEIFGERESQQILSLKNGLLIMEIKDNPNANDLRKYRIAYRAVARVF